MNFDTSLNCAQQLDEKDKLNSFRNNYHIPQHKGKDVIYFTGNSLGLQPKITQDYIQQELNDWARFGVEGHFEAKHPWFSYHENLAATSAKIVGANISEVVCMNQLTVNLHLLMVSFYRPTKQRFKILCEEKAFPSDQYAIESQVKFHGFDESAIIEVKVREGEHYLREEDVLKAINDNADSLALVLIGGVNYYSGQLFDIQKITSSAQNVGAIVGWDLAHAAGNVELRLHDWNVDFASWCTYKYLNSGPGGISGVFVHQRHHKSDLPRFAGWWGHDKSVRFKMEKGFIPMNTAEAWQLSNAPILSMAALRASLQLFEEAGLENLRAKSESLTAYLEFLIQNLNHEISQKKNYPLEIITPEDKKQRGAQLSIIAHGYGKNLYQQLINAGVISDWREPNVIRLAPVPMYNTFTEMYRFVELLKPLLSH